MCNVENLCVSTTAKNKSKGHKTKNLEVKKPKKSETFPSCVAMVVFY
jgi:hypothetical protein